MLTVCDPCGSCPYRRDVPSGIWDASEYTKLPQYDGETWEQSPAVFLCHQRNGKLCGGWVACHGAGELLALRMARNIDPAVFSFETKVPVFASGAAARAHGVRQIAKPTVAAKKKMAGIVKLQSRSGL